MADALALVEAAEQRLWTPEGTGALESLRGRGLTDDTIRQDRLGWTPGVMLPTSDGARFWRASGIVIPWWDRDRLALVKIRQPEGRTPKYVEAYRDRPRIYPGPAAIRPGMPLIITEGELDCLLMAQELGELAAVVTLGSASARPEAGILALMLPAPTWFIALDADPAGDKAAAEWPAHAIRVRPPTPDKDWTEVHARGFNRIRFLWGGILRRVEKPSDPAPSKGPAAPSPAATREPGPGPPPWPPRPPELATWPIQWRERWGLLANALEDQRIPWPDHERLAFDQTKAEMEKTTR